ncbi:ring-opening amidohydrolase [Nocardioides convexus]|uniref:ring-opening amidohydrolase n=1 Tax=Nocardioides convexus TaxID=2712224 RepID=UPI002418393A|nr:ring-opening amidohydrolase [Nocardioides convexus]
MGKTEGNGGVNDYTRIIADRAFREVLVAKGAPEDQVKQVPIVWSGGTDGVISPHATIFATVDVPEDDPSREEQRLTVGFAMSEPILPEEIGYTAMIEKVAAGVKVAMERAGITDVADVHYVQTKTPLLTIHTIRDAHSRGKEVWTEHTHESMDLSNGVTGLGIAVALGEIEMPTDADVMNNRDLYSSVASCSSGVETRRGADRRGRQRQGRRRPVPDRPLGHEGRARPGRHLGGHQVGRSRPARASPHGGPRRQGSSTSSSSARRRRTARSAGAATRCSTTPTCTGTARSSPASAA